MTPTALGWASVLSPNQTPSALMLHAQWLICPARRGARLRHRGSRLQERGPGRSRPGTAGLSAGSTPAASRRPRRAHFANPRNDFWRLLARGRVHSRGCTTRRAVRRCPSYGIGITNAAYRTTPGSGDLRQATSPGQAERLEAPGRISAPARSRSSARRRTAGRFGERPSTASRSARLGETSRSTSCPSRRRRTPPSRTRSGCAGSAICELAGRTVGPAPRALVLDRDERSCSSSPRSREAASGGRRPAAGSRRGSDEPHRARARRGGRGRASSSGRSRSGGANTCSRGTGTCVRPSAVYLVRRARPQPTADPIELRAQGVAVSAGGRSGSWRRRRTSVRAAPAAALLRELLRTARRPARRRRRVAISAAVGARTHLAHAHDSVGARRCTAARDQHRAAPADRDGGACIIVELASTPHGRRRRTCRAATWCSPPQRVAPKHVAAQLERAIADATGTRRAGRSSAAAKELAQDRRREPYAVHDPTKLVVVFLGEAVELGDLSWATSARTPGRADARRSRALRSVPNGRPARSSWRRSRAAPADDARPRNWRTVVGRLAERNERPRLKRGSAAPAVRDRHPPVAAEGLRAELHAGRRLAALVLGPVDQRERALDDVRVEAVRDSSSRERSSST